MRMLTLCGAAAATTLSLSGSAHAAHLLNYRVNFTDPSGFGASGSAALVFDTLANTLKVDITATGFDPDMLHVQHIHGRFDASGNAIVSVTPTIDDDTDGDGVLELLEGAPLYGGILLSLFDESQAGNAFGGFPSASGGDIDFSYTYDLGTTTALNMDPNGDGDISDAITAADILPLNLREIVIHGAFLKPGVGGVGNEMAGNDLFDNGGYSNFVPVLVGQITVAPVPLPAAGLALVAALGGLGGLRLRRRRSA